MIRVVILVRSSNCSRAKLHGKLEGLTEKKRITISPEVQPSSYIGIDRVD